MTDQARGGSYFDFGNGRGPIHESDLNDEERCSQGLPPNTIPGVFLPPSAPVVTTEPTVQETTDV